MGFGEFSVIANLLLAGFIIITCARLRLVLGGFVLKVLTANGKTALSLMGVGAAITWILLFFLVREIPAGAPDWVVDYYRDRMFMSSSTAIATTAGFIATYIEGQIREEGIYYRGFHTWEQILHYSVEDCVLRMGIDKTVWLTGKSKQIKWDLQDGDSLAVVVMALEKHGIREKKSQQNSDAMEVRS